MNQQDQQAIDDLFQFLNQRAAQGGPGDPQAEARIQQHFQQGPPGLLYQMAQTLVAQRYTLQQTQAQLAECRQQSGAPAGFAPPAGRGMAQPGYGGYGYGTPAYRQGGGGSGFLAGAGQLALGIGGGILGAEMLSDLFRGDGLFGGGNDERSYEAGYDAGYNAGDDQGAGNDQGADYGQGNGADYDSGAGYDNGGGYDDGGYDGGGFDSGDGGW
jgi:uncharacterized protein